MDVDRESTKYYEKLALQMQKESNDSLMNRNGIKNFKNNLKKN